MADARTLIEDVGDPRAERLCYLVAQGLHLTDEATYVALVGDPNYRCGHCGRTARSSKNVCVPIAQ